MKKGQTAYLLAYKTGFSITQIPKKVGISECEVLSVGREFIQLLDKESEKKIKVYTDDLTKSEFGITYTLFYSVQEAERFFDELYENGEINSAIKQVGLEKVYYLPIQMRKEIFRAITEMEEHN